MELTNEIIEECGFSRVNNSMWRSGNITLQNGWNAEGKTVYERLLSIKKAYKVCVYGKYLQTITTVTELEEIVRRVFDNAGTSKCNKHGVSGSVCPECGGKLTHNKEYDVHPYGDNIEYDQCEKCGRKFWLKCF